MLRTCRPSIMLREREVMLVYRHPGLSRICIYLVHPRGEIALHPGVSYLVHPRGATFIICHSERSEES